MPADNPTTNPWSCRVCGATLAWPSPIAPSCPAACPLRDPGTIPESLSQAAGTMSDAEAAAHALLNNAGPNDAVVVVVRGARGSVVGARNLTEEAAADIAEAIMRVARGLPASSLA